MKTLEKILVSVLFLSFTACSYDFPVPPEKEAQFAERADLGKMVFLGGTRFSGVLDGAYSQASTEASVPNMMLRQANFITESQIVVPYTNISSGFNIYENSSLNGTLGRYSLFYPNIDTVLFKRKINSGEAFTFSNQNTDIQAFAFPGLSLLELTTSNSSNTYLNKFYPSHTTPLIEKAVQANPTFFVLDVGFDEIMNFSLNGAAGNPSVSNIAAFMPNDLMSPELFRNLLEQTVAELLATSTDTKGVLLNIPNSLLKLPIFSHVNPNLKSYGRLYGDGDGLFSQLQLFNGKLTEFYREHPNLPEDQKRDYFQFFSDVPFWGIIAADATLSDIEQDGYVFPKLRPAFSNEYVVYRKENQIRSGYGSNFNSPIPDGNFITRTEAKLIQERIAQYNEIIRTVVENSNGRLALANVGGQLDNLFAGYSRELGNDPEGVTVDGVFYEPLISEFGIISADGLNFNLPGKAIFANTIIDEINRSFGGNLKRLNPNIYAGTKFILLP